MFLNILVGCGCLFVLFFFFFKQKTAYEMSLRDWSSDVCSSDLIAGSYDLAPLRWCSTMQRAWRSGLAGDLDRAEKLIDEARMYGEQCAIAGATETAYVQLGELRWHQSRLPEMLPFSEAAYAAADGAYPGIGL